VCSGLGRVFHHYQQEHRQRAQEEPREQPRGGGRR
jgi:hypothetical protein